MPSRKSYYQQFKDSFYVRDAPPNKGIRSILLAIAVLLLLIGFFIFGLASTNGIKWGAGFILFLLGLLFIYVHSYRLGNMLNEHCPMEPSLVPSMLDVPESSLSPATKLMYKRMIVSENPDGPIESTAEDVAEPVPVEVSRQ